MSLTKLTWSGFLIFGLAGCAGYRLGPASGVAAGSKTIQVNFFRNSTLEPRLVEAVAFSLRKRLQQEGTYRLNTHGDGEIIVNGVITQFWRSELTLQPNDVITVQDYTLYLRTKVTAIERSTGKVVLDQEISGHTTIRVGNDLASSERQAVPLLADDLARNVTDRLVDGTW
ncbi:MAG: LPS assembly lipoprotein LptE [Verrucomicrobiota bacterium]